VTETILDLAEFEVWLAEFRDQHRAGGPGSGRFARTPRGQLDALSCADFAVIDYTVGPWPLAGSERDARVRILQSFQATPSGLFVGGDVGPGPTRNIEPTPDDEAQAPASGEAVSDAANYCRTGYFVSTLELLGARPLHPIRAMDKLRTPPGLDSFLGEVDWSRPGLGLCRASAVASCFAIMGDVGPEWFERFFARLAREADDERERAPADSVTLRSALGLMTIYDRLRAALPRPGDDIKMALGLQEPDGLFNSSGPGWGEFAAAFVLERGLRQSGKLRKEVLAACEELLRASAGFLLDAESREVFADDPHRAAGAVSMLAALAETLPGAIRSRRPLRLFTGRHLFV
jgi:hypothetical protein